MIQQIPRPTTVSYNKVKDNMTQVIIEPCYPGYGITIGNALRRVLLSSLPGSAVSAVKIDGVKHEYDTIDGVKEDIVEILMNLKKLRVVSHSDEPVMLELYAKGEKIVTAADIKKNSDVDVVNTDLVIANLTDKKAELRMEITVTKGMGYESVEDRKVENKDIVTIQIDSLYSPIANVGFNIEHTRVGQKTDYEKIILTVTTDGTIKAEDAVKYSVQILLDQISSITESTGKKKSKKTNDAEKIKEEVEEDTKE